VKDWLLREGCRNAVMNEYTALICARAAGLVAALRAPAPDDALLDGAGTILSALTGGPAAGIEEYADGPEAVELYLGHLRRRELELRDLNVAASIGRIVDGQRDDPKAWERWRVPAAAIEVQLSSIKDRPDWPAKIEAGLASPDPSVFSEAAEAAKLFGIDTWDVYFDRLQRGEDVWFFVMQTDDPLRIDRVIRLAEERLPLDAIATGPADELGLGPGFEAHGALDFVLQDLGRFAGRGWALIRTGLRSPVVRNRHMAVRALAAWQRSEWPGEADLLLRQSAKAEPDGELRGAMENLIAGRPSR
jgi:hypothetical protein